MSSSQNLSTYNHSYEINNVESSAPSNNQNSIYATKNLTTAYQTVQQDYSSTNVNFNGSMSITRQLNGSSHQNSWPNSLENLPGQTSSPFYEKQADTNGFSNINLINNPSNLHMASNRNSSPQNINTTPHSNTACTIPSQPGNNGYQHNCNTVMNQPQTGYINRANSQMLQGNTLPNVNSLQHQRSLPNVGRDGYTYTNHQYNHQTSFDINPSCRVTNDASTSMTTSKVQEQHTHSHMQQSMQPGQVPGGNTGYPQYILGQQQQLHGVQSQNGNCRPGTGYEKVEVKEEAHKQEFDDTESIESSLNATSIDIKVSNVVCKYRTRCHIDLREVARSGFNTIYDKSKGKVLMQLRKPYCWANIWSSGKISIYGSNSEKNCHIAARRVSRYLHKLGFKIKMCGFQIVNVLATCKLPFGVDLSTFYAKNQGKHLSYEPELHTAANYKILSTGANLKIFSNGSITATARNVQTLEAAIQEIYPLLEQFQKPIKLGTKTEIKGEVSDYDDNSPSEDTPLANKRKGQTKKKKPIKRKREIDSDDEDNMIPPTPGPNSGYAPSYY